MANPSETSKTTNMGVSVSPPNITIRTDCPVKKPQQEAPSAKTTPSFKTNNPQKSRMIFENHVLERSCVKNLNVEAKAGISTLQPAIGLFFLSRAFEDLLVGPAQHSEEHRLQDCSLWAHAVDCK